MEVYFSCIAGGLLYCFLHSANDLRHVLQNMMLQVFQILGHFKIKIRTQKIRDLKIGGFEKLVSWWDGEEKILSKNRANEFIEGSILEKSKLIKHLSHFS